MIKWLDKYYPVLLLTILAFSFFTRVAMIHKPSGYIFDEVYHAVTAKLIAKNDHRAYEWWNPPPEPDTAVDWLHPPLAKYTQASFIYILGEYPFAWRLSSAIFGVGVVWMTALLAQELFNRRSLSLLAALIASLDGLLLVMSRIAMNDIHVVFFILMTLMFYTKHLKINLASKKYQWSKYLLWAGISAGLAVGTKWSGMFALAAVGISEGLVWLRFTYAAFQKKKKPAPSLLIKQFAAIFAVLVVLPAAIYLLSYSHMFLQGKGLSHFVELHNQTIRYQTSLDATHPAQSRPWEWFLNAKPVWVAVDRVSDLYVGNIYALGNPAVFILGALSVAYVMLGFVTRKIKLAGNIPLLFLIFSYFMVWLPWQFSPRIMFFYHYAPAVPLMAIIISFVIHWIWKKFHNDTTYYLLSAVVLTMVLAFIIWYPHWTNIPMPTEFVDNVYFMFERWK